MSRRWRKGLVPEVAGMSWVRDNLGDAAAAALTAAAEWCWGTRRDLFSFMFCWHDADGAKWGVKGICFGADTDEQPPGLTWGRLECGAEWTAPLSEQNEEPDLVRDIQTYDVIYYPCEHVDRVLCRVSKGVFETFGWERCRQFAFEHASRHGEKGCLECRRREELKRLTAEFAQNSVILASAWRGKQ